MSGQERVLEGGCLCGAVRYRARTAQAQVALCHCTHCQKQSGSAFSVLVVLPAEALAITGQPAEYLDTGESGGRVTRRFCGVCGSPLFSALALRPELAVIKAGTLDDTAWLEPKAQFWCRSAQPWVALDAAIPTFALGPPPG